VIGEGLADLPSGWVAVTAKMLMVRRPRRTVLHRAQRYYSTSVLKNVEHLFKHLFRFFAAWGFELLCRKDKKTAINWEHEKT
jgi:hypothetical protein